jgi:hypothetical protein
MLHYLRVFFKNPPRVGRFLAIAAGTALGVYYRGRLMFQLPS